MKKVAFWLFVIGVGNILFGVGSLLDDSGSSVNGIVSFIVRLFFSLLIIYTGYEINRLHIKGWYLLSGIILFLTGLFIISPIFILLFDNIGDPLEAGMVFLGQWVAAALMFYAWSGWWRQKKPLFIKARHV